MRNRPKQDPVDPTPVIPRGSNDFEEAQITRDFRSVFTRISDTEWRDLRSPLEYAYRCGFIAGKSRRQLDRSEGRKLPSYIQIL